MNQHIDVIATTISGSIRDWGKIKRIIPLFHALGEKDVSLYTADSHLEARERARQAVKSGSRILISAGGSGTFRSILEGCYDAKVGLKDLRLGFLRKGSADLIGKTLGMPDEIEEAVKTFVNSIRHNRAVPCDVLLASSADVESARCKFVGYGGAELFGEIPYYTENRFTKYYKGILSQLVGDLGPFFVGANLAILRRLPRQIKGKRRQWEILVDGAAATQGCFHAIIIVNGDLGPNLPFARSVPLGSGDFYVFAIRNMGFFKLYRQFRRAWNASIMDDPERWGFESFCVKKKLEIRPDDDEFFPMNVDGSTLKCRKSATIEIIDQIHLLSK